VALVFLSLRFKIAHVKTENCRQTERHQAFVEHNQFLILSWMQLKIS